MALLGSKQQTSASTLPQEVKIPPLSEASLGVHLPPLEAASLAPVMFAHTRQQQAGHLGFLNPLLM